MSFDFFKPSNIKEASELLKNPGYVAVVGGTDTVVKVNIFIEENLWKI